ncbi:MAG: pseudouridine synthase [Rhodothermales bacterium]
MPKPRRKGSDAPPSGPQPGSEGGAAGNPHDSSTRREGMRLNRYIARAGVCSRRDADKLIEAGRVKVNGKVVTEFSTYVSDDDEVEANGSLISPTRHMYILVNKPTDTIATKDDPSGRRTVMDLLRLPDEEKGSLFPVGRLDRDTTGVLLVTNDGILAHRLMHPSFEVDKLYLVRTSEAVKPHEIDLLKSGIELDDGVAAADEAAYVALPDRHQVGLRLHEGRNRQIRRMFEVLGHDIEHLERVNYGGLTTEGVRPGKWRRLVPFEVKRLKRLVNLN